VASHTTQTDDWNLPIVSLLEWTTVEEYVYYFYKTWYWLHGSIQYADTSSTYVLWFNVDNLSYYSSNINLPNFDCCDKFP